MDIAYRFAITAFFRGRYVSIHDSRSLVPPAGPALVTPAQAQSVVTRASLMDCGVSGRPSGNRACMSGEAGCSGGVISDPEDLLGGRHGQAHLLLMQCLHGQAD